MLCKLAWGNVRRAGRDYLVYLLTLTLAVTVFYAFNTISVQADLVFEEVGLPELLGSIMGGLTVFLAVVMGFLMVYANNFIMKRRKKEFGLYQVLGMSRAQVALVMAFETAIVSGASLVLGIALGIGFSQLMTFFTASLFRTQISDFKFIFSLWALLLTVGCLVAIFFVTLVFNLRVVRRSRIADLMSAGRKNEAIKVRNPIWSAVIFGVGVVFVGVAYRRLLHDGLPIEGNAADMDQFTFTTCIVVVGTILVFFGLSGFLLKIFQGARGLYWRGLNMFTLRQLAAKVNTVSASMAVISMILFLAITSVTGGMSIASVMNSNAERGTIADYTRAVFYFGADIVSDPTRKDDARMSVATEPIDILGAAGTNVVNAGSEEGCPFNLAGILDRHVQVDIYDSRPAGVDRPFVTLGDIAEAVEMPLPKGTGSSNANTMGLQVMKESSYNRYLDFRGMSNVDLGEDGYLITCDMGDSLNKVYNAALRDGVEVVLGDRTLRPVIEKVDEGASALCNTTMGSNAGTIVVPDGVVDAAGLPLYQSYLLGDYKEGLSYEETEGYVRQQRSWGPIFNPDGSESAFWGTEMTRAQNYESMNSMNGIISYLAIYIGFVLVVACAAILTIQQLSGVADSGKNYRILSELGTPRREIMRSVLIQQAIFFVFPLIMGVAHSLVALRVVVDVVELFGHISIGGTVGVTCAIFLLCYGGYFVVTYIMSKGIVSDSLRLRHAQ